MPNLCVLLGTGYFGEDVWMKSPWIKELNPEINSYVISRIDPSVHFHKYLKNLIGTTSYNVLKTSYEDVKNNSKDFKCIYHSKKLKNRTESSQYEKFQEWLGISLKYLASFDRRYYDQEKMVDNREDIKLRNYLAGLVSFFKEYFIKNNIDYFINTIEDDTYSVVGYYVAKRLGIKIIGLMASRFPKKGLMLCENFNKLLKWNYEHNNVDSLKLGTEIVGRNTLEKNREYWSLKSYSQRIKGLNYIKKYKTYSDYLIKIYPYEHFTFENRSTKSEILQFLTKIYRKTAIKTIIKEPDISNKKYFIFPLHFTQDAQITFREPLMNQFEIIRNMSRVTPQGYFIYVKPHPHYFGTDLSLKELKSLSKLQNVEIINPYFDFHELILNSQGVITINSTTGFEALSLGIPVMSWGHDFYCKKELCYLVRDKNDAAKQMMLMTNKFKNQDIITDFLFDVHNNTIWTEGKETNLGIIRLTEKDGKAVALAIEKIIKA